MISAWTKHLDTPEDKERFQKEILGSKRVLDRLSQLINEIEVDQDMIERNPKMYELPNWDYRQAHLNGYKQCLKTITTIINLDQGKQ
jgi:hypothetical protein